MKQVIFVFISILMMFCSAHAQDLNFKIDVITHANSPQQILFSGDTLFAATSGGLIQYNTTTGNTQIFTAIDGIHDHRLAAIAHHNRGTIVCGAGSGNLAFLSPATGDVYNDGNLANNTIRDLLAIGDTLWVLSPTFVTVYLYDQSSRKFQFRESYREFGQSVGDFRSLAYGNDRIWIASANGLINADGDFLSTNLYAGGNWQVLTTANGLPTNSIKDITTDPSGSLLWIAANGSLLTYDYNSFSTPIGYTFDDIISEGDNLLAINSSSVFRVSGSTVTTLDSGPATGINAVGRHPVNGQVWLATNKFGLRNIDSGIDIVLNGPLDNYIGEVLLDKSGRLWAASGLIKDERKEGVFVRLADGTWQNYQFSGGNGNSFIFSNSTLGLLEDEQQNVWVTSWGGGVIVFDQNLSPSPVNTLDLTGKVWINSVTSNDTLDVSTRENLRGGLSPVSSNQYYTVITDVMRDNQRQSIWLLNYAPTNGQALVEFSATGFDAAAPAEAWNSYSLPVGANELNEITQDVFGDLWISSTRGVVQVRITEGTIQTETYQESDNLKSNLTRAIAADDDGYVWVGTSSGLSAILNGTVFDFRGEFQPVGLQINDIFVDSQNNKWFATDKGVSILQAAGSPFNPNSWVHIVPRNSTLETTRQNLFIEDLPTEMVHSIYLDSRNGDAYFGSDAGIFIIRKNPFASQFETYAEVQLGPNPFVVAEGNVNFLSFYNLVGGSEVKILSPNGQLIRKLDPQNFNEVKGAAAVWDGRNEDGKLVISGVYVYLITSETGEDAAGKFLLIRQ